MGYADNMPYEQQIKERLMQIADLMGMNWDEIDCELYLTRKDNDLDLNFDDQGELDPLDPQNG